jgi:uncharacterized membrane protein
MRKSNLGWVTLAILLFFSFLNVISIALVGSGKAQPFWLTPLTTLTAFVFAFLHAGQFTGWRNAILLVVVSFVVSLAMESAGVATGWVYGPYHYGDRLGPKFIGLVPWLIPAAWFMMMYPAFIMARLISPKLKNHFLSMCICAVIGAVAMTAWDMVMDPVMAQGGYWIWDTPGQYFGIPIQNYFGWFVTVGICLLVYQFLAGHWPNPAPETIQPVWAVLSYAVTGLSTVIVACQLGLSGAALAGTLAMFPWLAWSFCSLSEKRRQHA